MIHTVMAEKGDKLAVASFREYFEQAVELGVDANVLQRACTDLLAHGYVAVEVSDSGEVLRVVKPDELIIEQADAAIDAAEIYATNIKANPGGDTPVLIAHDEPEGMTVYMENGSEVTVVPERGSRVAAARWGNRAGRLFSGITKHQRREWRRQERSKHGRRKR